MPAFILGRVGEQALGSGELIYINWPIVVSKYIKSVKIVKSKYANLLNLAWTICYNCNHERVSAGQAEQYFFDMCGVRKTCSLKKKN